MTDFRALCAELVEKLDELNCHYNVPNQSAMIERARTALAEPEPEGLTDNELDYMANEAGLDLAWRPELRRFARFALARAALAKADGPAVPESREPASVITEPSDQELLDIAASTIEPYECSGITTDEYEPETECAVEAYGSELIAFARAVLARWGNPVPLPPAKGEVAELVAELQSMATDADRRCRFSNAERLSRAAELLQRLSPPPPVPVSERLPGPEDCDANGRCWLCYTNVCNVTQWTLVLRSAILDWPISHWLPAHALPLPEVGA